MQNYASTIKARALPEADSNIIEYHLNNSDSEFLEEEEPQAPKNCKCIFDNYYFNLSYKVIPRDFHRERSYEHPDYTYYVVFIPLNRAYDQNKESFEKDISRIEKWCRNNWRYKRIFITREIMNCAKIHYNVCVTTDVDLLEIEAGAVGHRYGINQPRRLHNRQEIDVVINYMIKESKRRPLKDKIDRYIYRKA